MLRKAAAIIAKDLRVEFRTRYALNALLMFALVTLTAVSYTTSGVKMESELLSALLWIVMFFSSLTGMGRSFMVEEDAHTAPLLRVFASGTVTFWGKFLTNLLLLAGLGAITLPLYLFLMRAGAGNLGLHIMAVALGVIGLSGGATIVAAIVAQSSARGALLTALAFPILLPLLALVIPVSAAAFAGQPASEVSQYILGLISYSGALITASALLFDFVWR
ncbi:MAG: heme exporter protein CcmB [Candidatus Zixiibacteriota bacterium]